MRNTLIILFFIVGSICLNAQGNSWSVVSSMPIPVSGPEAVVQDSLIYILGGYSDSARGKIDIIQEYNPKRNTWRVLSQRLKVKREGFLITPYKDSVVILGGASSNASGRHQMEIWRPGGTPAIFKVNNNFNRSYSTGTIYRDKLYLIGGAFNTSQRDTSLHYIIEYNLATNQVTYRFDSTFSQFRQPALQMGVVQDSSFYVFGGVVEGTLTSIFRFDFWNRKMNRLTEQLPRSRAGGKAIKIRERGVMIIGGYNDQRALNTTEYVQIKPDNRLEFTSGPSLVYPRWDIAVVLFENSLYVFGGEELFGNSIAAVERLENVTAIKEGQGSIPNDFSVHGNFPNPFNPQTNIRFSVPERMTVTVDVFSVEGSLLRTLAANEFEAGTHNVLWDGKDNYGNTPGSGIYFYRIKHKTGVATGKMLLLK